MTISVDIDVSDLAREIKGVRRRSARPRVINRRISRLMLEAVRENFRQQGRPPWRRRKDLLPHPILRKSGRLFNSLRATSNAREASVSTNVVYAGTHNFGRGPIPARPFLVLPDRENDLILDALEDYLTGAR